MVHSTVSLEEWKKDQEHESNFYREIHRSKHRDRIRQTFWSYWMKNFEFDPSMFAEKTILDIGCGPTGLINFIRGGTKIGVDPLVASYARNYELPRDVSFIKAVGEAFPLRSEAIDVVTSINGLDHYISPHSVLAEIRRVLKVQGVLLLDVNVWKHPFRSLRIKLANVLLGRREKIAHKGHPHAFSVMDVKRILQASGFENLRFIPKVNPDYLEFSEYKQAQRVTSKFYTILFKVLHFFFPNVFSRNVKILCIPLASN